MYCVGGVIYLVGTLVNGFFIGFFHFATSLLPSDVNVITEKLYYIEPGLNKKSMS